MSWRPLELSGPISDLLTLNALNTNNAIARFMSNGTERGAVYNPAGTTDMVVRGQGDVQLIADHANPDDIAELSINGLNRNAHRLFGVESAVIGGSLATAVTAAPLASATTLTASQMAVEINTTANITFPALTTCQGRVYELVSITPGQQPLKATELS